MLKNRKEREMQSRNKLVRTLKFLGKAVIGLLLFLAFLIFLVHLPLVQNRVTKRLTTYLSTEMKGKVSIRRMEFSIFGSLTIKDAEVWDPGEGKIFDVELIKLKTNLYDVFSGRFIFDEIYIKGLNGHLTQNEEGLNIQFIIDAFQSDLPKDTTVKGLKLDFEKVKLEDIAFDYISTIEGIALHAKLDNFESTDGVFFTEKYVITSEKLLLEHAVVDILSTALPDSTNASATRKSNPDFGLGVGVVIGEVEFKDCEFSYHVKQVGATPKFDPSHVDLTELNLKAIDIVISPDSLSAVLDNLSAVLPGIGIGKAMADVKMNRHHLSLSGLDIVAGTNKLQGDITSWFEETPEAGFENPGIKMNAKASFNPEDFAYILSDDIMAYFKGWQQTDLSLTGDYIPGRGNMATLALKTSNSQIEAKGIINHIWDDELLSWQDMDIKTIVGADFRNALAPFIKDIKLPPSMTLQMRSTGSPKQMLLDGKFNSTWGSFEAVSYTHLTLPTILRV